MRGVGETGRLRHSQLLQGLCRILGFSREEALLLKHRLGERNRSGIVAGFDMSLRVLWLRVNQILPSLVFPHQLVSRPRIRAETHSCFQLCR